MSRSLYGPARVAAPSAIGAALVRRPRAWLVPTGLVAAATVLILAATPARYTARSELLIDTGAPTLPRSDAGDAATVEAVAEAAVASAGQAIGSADLARRTIKALHLQGNPDFDPLAGGMNPLSRLMTLFGLLHDPVDETADARLIEAFETALSVQVESGPRVVVLEFTNRDPQLAARVVNEVVDLFLEQRSAVSRTAAKQTIDALAARIATLRTDLADAEAARTTSPPGRDATSGGRLQADTAALLARARGEQSDAQSKADAIRDLLRDGRAADVAEIATSVTLRQIASQRAEAQTDLSLAARTLLPEHPRIKELTGQIKDYDAALKTAAKQVAASLDAQAKLAGQRVADLEAALARQPKTTGAGPSVGRSIAADRDIQSLRDQLGAATVRYDRLVAAQASAQPSSDARVILRAAPPRAPSSPKPVPIVIGATLATLLCSMVWVVARDGRHRRLAAVEPDAWSAVEEDEKASAGTDPIVAPEPTRRPAMPFEPRRGPLARFAVPERKIAEDDDAVLLPPVRPAPTRATSAAFLPRAREILARSKAYLEAFGRPGAESRDRDIADRRGFDEEEGGVGWELARARSDEPSTEHENAADDGSVDQSIAEHVAVADRIVAGHVPGRGLHVVGTGIGADAAASRDLVAMSRALAERGRCIVVDLNATPSRLAALGAAENGRLAVMALDGLAELLAGEASFAEVIHRDFATRLHFIPTGRKEADFRDFDLILDALTETYDFIVLLAPAFPQSEIAKVMAPYADLVVLSAAADVDDATLHCIEGELTAAGAREVLVTGGRGTWNGARARVA